MEEKKLTGYTDKGVSSAEDVKVTISRFQILSSKIHGIGIESHAAYAEISSPTNSGSSSASVSRSR